METVKPDQKTQIHIGVNRRRKLQEKNTQQKQISHAHNHTNNNKTNNNSAERL